jgi:molybdopterin converting factor small subunit
MNKCKSAKIKVTLNYRGLWHLPFVGSKTTEVLYFPSGATVETLINWLTDAYGEEFRRIKDFCNLVIDGRVITPPERRKTELKDGQWVRFLFGFDGG